MKSLVHSLRRLRSLFAGTSNASLDAIEEMLIQADAGVKYASMIRKKLQDAGGDRVQILQQEIVRLLSLDHPRLVGSSPWIIMVSGVNGSGKTTTVAKLANLYKRDGSVLLVSADTYRDAAHEQLDTWAKRAGVETVGSQRGQDAASVVHDALSKAFVNKIDHVVIDTAGRLHTRSDLMEELKKILRVVRKFKSDGPDLNLLTIDASLGQNSIEQARTFGQAVSINGLVLAKFDGTARGGAIIPICNELHLPVVYLGVGEGIDDIVAFDPEEFARSVIT